jgi:hypothetical protein
MVTRNDREEALVREEASQKMLRESIDLNNQMIAKSEQLLSARAKHQPQNQVRS